jgi:putative spermidine/putrescine transport system substrate-binding protein
MKRRDFLTTAGAAIVGAPFATIGTARAQAAAKPERIVMMTWGGLWGDSMRAGVDTAFEKATGVKVVQDRSASPVERITKLKIGLDNQTIDVVQIHDGLVPLAVKQGVFEPIDRNSPRLTNLKDVYPQFVGSHWVAMIFSPLGVVYNTKLVKNPPTGFADLWRPEFKGRIVLPEISHSIGPYIIPIGAMAEGKSPKDAETGFAKLKKMTDLRPIWAKDTDSIMNALRDEEAVIGLLYKSQSYTVQGWGTPAEWVFPKEGAILYSSGTAIAKNTRNRALAEQYLNMTLDPHLQGIATKNFNYPGTNRKMVDLLPPELQERARVSDAELARIIQLDHEFMSDQRAAWTDRWNRIVAGG